MKIYVAAEQSRAEQSRAEEVLKKKQRQDETQFTTKIGGKKKKTSLGLSYFVL